MSILEKIFGDPAKNEGLKTPKEIAENRRKHLKEGVKLDAQRRKEREATAAKELTAEDKHLQKVQTKERFREQCYLVSQMSELAKLNQNNKYQTFTSLVQDDPTTTINQFFYNKKMMHFPKIKNHQLALLVPLIKFSLVEWKGTISSRHKAKETQFRFQGTHMDLNELLKDPSARGKNLGMQSFSWRMHGPDPDMADKQITATMELFGDSLKVFEDSMNDKLLSFAHPGSHMEYKAVLGWSSPSKKTDIIGPELQQAIEESKTVLLLSYHRHEFEFEQDGSFKLTIDYHGRIESSLGEINIVGPASETEAKEEIQQAHDKQLFSKFNKEVLGDKSENNLTQERVDKFLASLHPNDLPAQKAAAEILRKKLNQTESVRQGAQQRYDSKQSAFEDITKKEIQKQAKSRKSERYKRIIKTIEDLGGSGGKVYNIQVNKQQLESYFSKYGGWSSKKMPTHPKPHEKDDKEKPEKDPKPAAPAPKLTPKPAPNSTPPAVDNRSLNLKAAIDAPRSQSRSMSISFIFMGDLIEALLGISKYQLESRRIQFLLGTMVYKNRFTGRQEVISMADIPISVRRFSAWFHKNYVKHMSNKIPLNSFLNKLVVELIRPAFGSECFGDLGVLPGTTNRVGLHTFSTDSLLPKGRRTLTSLKGKFHNTGKRVNGESIKYKQVVFTSNMDASPISSGDPTVDAKKGVIHLALGADRGLLKQANFSKSTIPGRREHLMMSEKMNTLERANEPYDTDLTMIGNTLFRPGTRFFLTPSIAGSGGGALAARLGLGGYYIVMSVDSSISRGSYETTCRAKFENTAYDLFKKKKSVGKVAKSVKSLTDDSIKKLVKGTI